MGNSWLRHHDFLRAVIKIYLYRFLNLSTAAKRLLTCFGLAVGVVCSFNVFLALKMDSVPELIMRQMRATPRIDLLFLGNSLMQSGLDSDIFESAWPRTNGVPVAFNAGLGSSSPVEHYLLADQAYLYHKGIQCIIYGFFDFQMTKPENSGWNDLVGNRSFGYSTEPSTAASLYAPGSIAEQLRFRLMGAVPMLRGHSQLWKYVEIFRRSLEELGMPRQRTNQFGRVADFGSFALPKQSEFEYECENTVKSSTPFVPAIQQLLQLAHENNTKVIVVEMPMNSAHRNQCYSTSAWQRYRIYLEQRLQAEGASFVIASDWIADEKDFSDGLHLNKVGANAFSKKLAQVVADANRPN